jgi:hypothetical protein
VRDDVRAAGEGDGRRQRVRRRVRVGTRVEEDLGLHLDQPAVRVRVVAVAQEGRVAVRVAQEGFLPGRRQLHRAAGAQRQQAEREVETRVLAVRRRARDARDDDLHPVRLQAVAGRRHVAVAVRVGRGDVQLHAAVGAGHREAGLRADGGRVLAADAVEALDHHLARRLRVAVAQGDVADQVAVGVQGLGREGLLRVGDRFEDLVLDDDRRGRHARRVRVVGRDRREGLPVVAYDVGGEHGAVGRAVTGQRAARDVLVRDDRADAGHLTRVGGVDGDHARVRVRGTQDRRPQEPFGPQVGGVGEGALRLGARFHGGECRAEPVRDLFRLGGLHGGLRRLTGHDRPPSRES